MIEYLPWSRKSLNKSTEKYIKGELNILDIELGGNCNYSCLYCDSPERKKPSGVSVEKIAEVISSKKIDWVFICGIGEPTAKGNIETFNKILELCLKCNVKCSCFTNLSVLTESILNYINLGVLHILFKYDSADNATINDIYGTKGGKEQFENITKIKKLAKIENGSVNIAASIVPTKRNKNEIISIVKDCISNNIFPLIAELENSGLAQGCYNELSLSKEELVEIKKQIYDLIGEEYAIPICPSVICGMHINNIGKVTLDERTGLSCHWFWLEEPKIREIGDFNSQDFDFIKKKIFNYRKDKKEEVWNIYIRNINRVFGGCGGDLNNLFYKYLDLINNPNLIYLDNNATTKLSESVIKTIESSKYLYANPSSIYQFGKDIKIKIEKARESIANLINANPVNIIFTGCATESNNSIFHSASISNPNKKHIIISSVEHPSIDRLADVYKNIGYDITRLKVDSCGRINLGELKSNLTNNTFLVSIMMANNEIGNIYPIKEIVTIVKNFNSEIFVHTDAVQAIGKLDVNVKDLGVDFLSLSGHKFHAPKGIGCLFVKDPDKFNPFIKGGEQENKMRGGTENTISIIAIGQAAIETQEGQKENIEKMSLLRDYLEERLLSIRNHGICILGEKNNRICNTSCFTIKENNGHPYDGHRLVDMMDSLEMGICVSAGSACNSREIIPSSVMHSLGIDSIPIRISLSKFTTKEEIDFFMKKFRIVLNSYNIPK